MKRIKLSKAGMLTNSIGFKYDVNEIRKQINVISKHPEALSDHRAYTLSQKFKYTMNIHDISFQTICEVIRVAPNRIRKLIKNYPCYVYAKQPKSFLQDRQHYARLVADGILTQGQVVSKTGYSQPTISRWVTDYKNFGNKMTSQAIAFRRSI